MRIQSMFAILNSLVLVFRPLNAALAFILTIGLFMVLAPVRDEPFFRAPSDLRDLLGLTPAGWTAEDRPLGATELLSVEARKTLRCDQSLYRVYHRGDVEVGLFIAYWRPGRIDSWEVAHHIPDTCWVLGGASILQRDDTRALAIQEGGHSQPGNWRLFVWSNQQVETVFWLLSGGRASGFPIDNSKFWNSRLRVLQAIAVNSKWGRVRREQVLVRLSTNRSLTELTTSDLWPILTTVLSQTGIVTPTSKSTSLR